MSQPGYPRPLDQPDAGSGVRFAAIGVAWRLISSDFSTWIVASLVLLGGSMIVILPIYLFTIFGTVGAAVMSDPAGKGSKVNTIPPTIAVVFIVAWFVVGVVGTGAGGLWMAAMMRLGLRKLRGEPATMKEFFSLDGHWPQIVGYNLLLPVLMIPLVALVFGVFGLVAGVLYRVSPAATVLVAVLGYLVALVGSYSLQALLQLTPLLIVDKKLSITDAAAQSFQALWPYFLPTLGVFFCASLLSVLGELACGIGIIVTLPITYVTMAVVYNDLFPLDSATE
jgi:hypothetical protein